MHATRARTALALALLTLAALPLGASEARTSGRLRAVWYEDPQDPSRGPRVRAFLVRAGKTVTVTLDEAALARDGGMRAVVGREVLLQRTEPQEGADERWTVATGEALVAAQGMGLQVGASATASVTASAIAGQQRWIGLLCKFADVSKEPHPRDYYLQMYADAPKRLGDYWRQVSAGAANIAGSDVKGWFTLPHPRSFYGKSPSIDYDALTRDCLAAADASVDFRPFYGINLFFNTDYDGIALGGNIGLDLDGEDRVRGITWFPAWGANNLSIVAHELGHGFGLPHSNNSDRDNDPYDNPWDVMSDAYRWGLPDATYAELPPQTIAEHKRQLGWIPAARLFEPPASGTYSLALTNSTTADATSYWMLRVPTSDGRTITAEARTRSGFDAGLVRAPAVVLHEVDDARSEPAWLIDKDVPPADRGDTEGAAWRAGESLRVPRHNVFDAGADLRVLSSSGDTTQLRLGYDAPLQLPLVTDPAAAAARRFGTSASIDGDLLAVATEKGEVAVYRRDLTVTGGWRSVSVLRTQPFLAATSAVDIDGGRIVVGCHYCDNVFVFEPVPGAVDQWQQVARIQPNIEYFGERVALQGDVLAVGANDNYSDGHAGAVYVFERQGGDWVLTSTLRSPVNGTNDLDLFGYSLDLAGDTLAVGAPYENEGSGAVYVYHRTAPGGAWVLEKSWGAEDSGIPAYWNLGNGVALSGSRLAFVQPTSPFFGGATYVVERSAGPSATWHKTATFEESTGWTVGLDGNLLASTTFEGFRVRAFDAASSTWRLVATPQVGRNVFALAVGPAGVVAGRPFEGGEAGSVTVWNRFCVSGDTALCLLGGRFELRAYWRTANASGQAKAVRLTDNTGYFWFFDANNVEAVVKVLDACALPGAKNFWVFAAGLTDQEVRLAVFDTWTGEVVDVLNPLSAGFAPVFETGAFKKSCAAPVGASSLPAAVPPPSASGATPVASPVATCTPGATVLCLNNGRYAVEGTWSTGSASGAAHVVALTADTGYLWFFAADNVEVVVKVLDACALNDAHWVFASGLTNQQVRLKVTDTVTGKVREWLNPQGTYFTPVRDTNAFAHSCS